MEKEIKVTPVGVIMECNECQNEMIFSNKKQFENDMVRYLHQCSNCQKEIWLEHEYPHVRFNGI